jgi:hypothetical protein
MDQGKKAVAGALAALTTFVLVATPAFAGEVDTDNEDYQLGAIAIVVLLFIVAIWFFVFRGKEDDTGADSSADSGPDEA